MLICEDKTLEELLDLDKLNVGEAVVCLAPTSTDYGKYEVYLKSSSNGYAYSGLFNRLENAKLYAEKILGSATSQDCLYCHSTLENTSATSTSGTCEWGNLTVTAPTCFTSFVNNKVSFMLNMKDADELFRTLSVLINSGYKITLMSGSGEDGYVITYSPSDLTCSIIG